MLAAPSLCKRPIKVPNLKSLKASFPFAWASERISVQMHNIQSSQFSYRIIKIYRLQAWLCSLFSPEIWHAGAVMGLRNRLVSRGHSLPCFVTVLNTVIAYTCRASVSGPSLSARSFWFIDDRLYDRFYMAVFSALLNRLSHADSRRLACGSTTSETSFL